MSHKVPYQYKHDVKAAGLIVNCCDHILLLLQSASKKWGVPKGGMLHNETPLQCAFRELTEETGLTLSDFLNPTIIQKVRLESHLIYHITIDAININRPIILSSEISQIKFIHINDLNKYIYNRVTMNSLRECGYLTATQGMTVRDQNRLHRAKVFKSIIGSILVS